MALSGSDRRLARLTGGDSRRVRLTGGDRRKPLLVQVGGSLELPSLQLSGEVSPLVEVSGNLSLPAVSMSGDISPRVEMEGELLLPSVQLSGGLSPAVAIGGALTLPSLQLSGQLLPWTPSLVPEVAAGFWWDSELFSGLGATSFRWQERNQVSSAWDQLQTTVALQPGQVVSNGVTLFRYRGTGDPNPTVTNTLAANAAGWTGATYVAGWFGCPAGVTSTNTLFRHSSVAGGRRIQAQRTATQYRLLLSSDGTAQATYGWNVASETALHFCEWIYDPAAAATARGKFAVDRVTLAAALAPSGPVSILNASSTAQLCNSFGVANPDETRVGMVYYANGIPSDANRDLLYRYKAPVIIP